MRFRVIASTAIFLFIFNIAAWAQNASEYYDMAVKSLEKGEKQQAAELIERAVAAEPSNIGYRRHLGWLLYDLGRYDESSRQFRLILRSWPDDFEAIKGLVYTYLQSNRRGAAVQKLQDYVRRNPENEEAVLLLAQVYSYSPRTRREAVERFKRILESDPTNREARKELAEAYSQGGLYADAIKSYRILLLDYPDDKEARLALARLYSWSGQFRESVNEYKKLLKTDPENFTYRHELARVLAWAGSYKESLERYRELISANPDSTELKLEYAETLSWSAHFNKSIREFERILEEDPDNQRAKLGLARAYHWKGAQYTAERIFEELLAADPENTDAMMGAAEAELWSNRLGKAKMSYEKLLEHEPYNEQTEEDLREIEERIAPIISPRAGYYKDSTSFERQSYGLIGTYHLTPDTPIELGFVRSRFEQHDEVVYRSTTGIRGSHLFADRFRVTLGYAFNDYTGDDTSSSYLAAGTLAVGDYTTVGGQVNRLDIVDTLTGEDLGIATFQYLGNGGTSIEAVQRAVNTTDYSAIFTRRLTPKLLAVASFTFGDVSDPTGQDKESRNITLIYNKLYREDRQFNILYNYYFLGFDEDTPLYFSPNSFENHALILQWRHRLMDRFSYGLDLSPMYQPGANLFGGLAAGFAELDLLDSLSLYTYAAYLDTDMFGSDDDEFRSRVFVVSLIKRF